MLPVIAGGHRPQVRRFIGRNGLRFDFAIGRFHQLLNAW
jgi:hypothetical protein